MLGIAAAQSDNNKSGNRFVFLYYTESLEEAKDINR
jgi:hypothetical protein